MKIGNLPFEELRRQLAGEGFPLGLGPFCVLVQSPVEQVARGLHFLYADHERATPRDFYDGRLAIVPVRGLRRLRGSRVRLIVDAVEWQSFVPQLAFGALEWGLNWFLFRRAHQYLILHAATLARGDAALLLPAAPGAGKSTLAAALMHRGWRVLSDELAIIDPETGCLVPLARPVILKDESIPALKRFEPAVRFGPLMSIPRRSRRITHARPPYDSVAAVDQPAEPRLLVFPRYNAGSSTEITPLSRADAMIRASQAAFNSTLHGREGFDLLARVVEGCDCYELVYSDLEEVTGKLNELVPAQSALVSV